MTESSVKDSMTIAGQAEQARAAREFVGAVLGPRHPCRDDAVLLASELFSNSVRHSRSRAPGGTITVTVAARDGLVRVEVTDRSGPGVPGLGTVDGNAEGGRGLLLVESLAAQWGWRRAAGRTVTWFEIRHG